MKRLISRAAGGLLLAASLSSAPVALAQDARELPEGGRLYQAHCSYCHAAAPGRPGTAALARRLGKERSVLESRTDLQPAYVAHVVRFGMGAMIPLRRTEVGDRELEAITAWLARPRAAEAPAAAAPGKLP